MTAATASSVQLLNLVYFGRPADAASLVGFPESGMSDEEIVLSFVNTAEYQSNTVVPNSAANLSGGRDFNVTGLINTFYNRLVGRDAASSEINGWVKHINDGAVNYDYLGITIANAINNLTEADGAAALAMKADMQARLDSADSFSDALAADAVSAAAYSNDAAIAAGQDFISGVGSTAATAADVTSSLTSFNGSDGSVPGATTFTLTVDSPTASEGDGGDTAAKSLTFLLSLDEAPTEELSINYQTLTTGTATAGDDFNAAAGLVTFAAGQSATTVSVEINGDTDFEAAETVSIKFSGASLSADVVATGSITNDDDDTANDAQSFILTSNADNFTGEAGDDTFSGVAGTIDGDLLDGGDGDDTLNITVSIDDDDNAAATISNIETISLRATGAAAGEVDLEFGDVTGVENLTFRRLNEDVTIDNLLDLDTVLTIENTGAAASNVIVNYDASQVSGTADIGNLTVSSTTAGADFTINGVETIAVTAVGEDNDIDIDGDDLEIVTVAGADGADISIDVDASVTTFTSTADSDVTMVATAAADITATGGAGDDTFTLGTFLTDADTIDGGDGTDTLGVTGAGGAVIPDDADVTNVETLDITTGGADTFDASIVSFDTVTTTIAANAHTIAMTEVSDEVITVRNGDAAGNADDDIADINIALATATGDADSLTVTIENRDADNEMAVTTTDFGVSDIETLNLAFVRDTDIADAAEFNIDDVNSAHDTINLSGTADVDIDVKDAATDINSTIVGDLELTLGAADHDISSAAGDDTFTFAGNLDSDDTIDGGAGDDTLTATPAAGVIASTISNVETLEFTFSTAGAAFNGRNATGVETVTIANATDESLTLSRQAASVTTFNLESTSTDASDAVTIRHTANTDAAFTVNIGDSAEVADVDLGTLTISDNAGALTVVSDFFAGNSLGDFAANDSDDVTFTISNDLEIDAGGAGDGNLDATGALSFTVTADGGDFLVDGATDIGDATSMSVTVTADDSVTFTGAVTATDLETLTVTADDNFDLTGNIVSDADVAVTLTADDVGDIRFNGILDVDHVTTLSATATDGGVITIDDIELLGVDADGDDIDSEITLSATGTDSSDDGSEITISAINVAAAATLDTLTVVGDADSTIDITAGAANLTITEIDASEMEGTFDIDTSTIAAAIDLTLGSGTNTVTTELDLADEITLADEAGTDQIDVQDDTTAADVITNFEAGADGDVISIDVSAIGAGAQNAASTALDASLVVSLATDDDGVLADADNTMVATDNILVLTDVFADSAAVFAAIDLDAETNVGGLLDNDVFLVAYTNGADSFVASITFSAADGASADAAADLVQLVGVTVSDLTADNFAFV